MFKSGFNIRSLMFFYRFGSSVVKCSRKAWCSFPHYNRMFKRLNNDGAMTQLNNQPVRWCAVQNVSNAFPFPYRPKNQQQLTQINNLPRRVGADPWNPFIIERIKIPFSSFIRLPVRAVRGGSVCILCTGAGGVEKIGHGSLFRLLSCQKIGTIYHGPRSTADRTVINCN